MAYMTMKCKSATPPALALAERLNIPLITTDHHEFDAVE
jgi:hypothetical protein